MIRISIKSIITEIIAWAKIQKDSCSFLYLMIRISIESIITEIIALAENQKDSCSFLYLMIRISMMVLAIIWHEVVF